MAIRGWYVGGPRSHKDPLWQSRGARDIPVITVLPTWDPLLRKYAYPPLTSKHSIFRGASMSCCRANVPPLLSYVCFVRSTRTSLPGPCVFCLPPAHLYKTTSDGVNKNWWKAPAKYWIEKCKDYFSVWAWLLGHTVYYQYFLASFFFIRFKKGDSYLYIILVLWVLDFRHVQL